MTKNELMELCDERGINCEDKKYKKDLIEILEIYDLDELEKKREKAIQEREKIEEYERKRRERKALGFEVEPIPLIRVDIYNFYEVSGYVLTRMNGKFNIDYISHCSCNDTEYDMIEEDFKITYEQLFSDKSLFEDEHYHNKALGILRDMILKHKGEILTWKPKHKDELLDYVDLTNN